MTNDENESLQDRLTAAFEQRVLDAIRGTPMAFADRALVVVDEAGATTVKRVYESEVAANRARKRYLTGHPLAHAYVVRRTSDGYAAKDEAPRRRR